MAFHVGQKVVCVYDFSLPVDDAPGPFPIKGEVYTVAWLGFELEAEVPDELALTLVEVEPVENDEFCKTFFAEHFRPVKITDISIFVSMLTKPPAKTKRVRT